MVAITDHCNTNIPGQKLSPHELISNAAPILSHPLPPCNGIGSEQFRKRLMAPPPHVVVHTDQADHGPKFPSTASKSKSIILYTCGVEHKCSNATTSFQIVRTSC